MLQRLLDNASWLLAEKALRLALGVVVGGWTARYLGPEQYGLLSYALAVVALFGILANAGIDRVVVRDIIGNPAARDAILGGAFVLKLAGGAVATAAAFGAALLLAADQPGLPVLVALTGFTLLAQAFDTVDLWFQSQLQSRQAVIARNIAFVAFAAVRIALILGGAPLAAFACAVLGESLLAAAALAAAYRLSRQRISAWRAERRRIRALVAQSWPLLLSGLMVAIYMRIDQILLGYLAGAGEVGIYAAGIVIGEACFAVPVAVVVSAAPLLAKTREADAEAYRRQFTLLFRWLAIFACAVALPVSLLSGPLIGLIFGEGYRASAPVLAIHVWGLLFVSLGLASGQYLTLANQNRTVLQRTLLGAVLSVALNMVWIPRYGAVGAAWAALLSYATTSLFLFQNPAARACLRLMLRAFWPR